MSDSRSRRSIRYCVSEMPPDHDPRRLAVFVLVTMEGAVMVARAYRNFEAYDAAIIQLRDYLERLLADALAHPQPDKARNAKKRSRRA